jgi:hypothetical protein
MPYYLNNIPVVEQGITITVSGGDADKGKINETFPAIPNPNITYIKLNFILDSSITNWTITLQTTAAYGAYYQNNTWQIVYGDGQKIILAIALGKTKGTIEIPVIIAQQDNTLPVVLSAFCASVNSQKGINLMWSTQSETGLNGYYLLNNKYIYLLTRMFMKRQYIIIGWKLRIITAISLVLAQEVFIFMVLIIIHRNIN